MSVMLFDTSKITPMTKDVLRRAWELSTPEATPLAFTPEVPRALKHLEQGSPLVTLGTFTEVPGIATLSQPQIRSRADALTMLTSAFRLAWQQETGRLRPHPTGEHRVLTGPQATAWVAERRNRPVVVDIETHGDISRLHHSERLLLCVGLCDGTETVVVDGEELGDGRDYARFLHELSHLKLIAHNGKFDLPVLAQGADEGTDLKLHHDTLLMHYALFPAAGEHGLKPLCKHRFGAPDWDNHGHDMRDLGSMDRAALRLYNAFDVQWTWRLFEHLVPMVESHEHKDRLYRGVLIRASNALQQIEPRGIGYDRDYAERLYTDLGVLADRQRADLVAEAHALSPGVAWPWAKEGGRLARDADGEKYREFNPGSPKQIKDLYAAQGVKLDKTDEYVMSRRAEKGDAFAEKLLAWRGTTKLRSTYVVSLLDKAKALPGMERPRVYPSYLIHGTSTGRLSSSHPNIQNIPRTKQDGTPSIRRMFVPTSADRLLVQVDYSQAELRVMAVLAGDPWLSEIFSNPKVDIFNQMMPSAFPDADIDAWGPDEAKNNRAKLKGVIYGLSFGRRAPAIADALRMPVAEAQRIIDNYLASAAKVAEWREEVSRKAVHGIPLVSPFGRHFQHEVVTPRGKDDVVRKALSFLPQSTASDICLRAACRIIEEQEESGGDWNVVALVHDAITVDVPAYEAEDAAKYVSEHMVRSARDTFPDLPFAVEAKYGDDWAKTS